MIYLLVVMVATWIGAASSAALVGWWAVLVWVPLGIALGVTAAKADR